MSKTLGVGFEGLLLKNSNTDETEKWMVSRVRSALRRHNERIDKIAMCKRE